MTRSNAGSRSSLRVEDSLGIGGAAVKLSARTADEDLTSADSEVGVSAGDGLADEVDAITGGGTSVFAGPAVN